MRHKIYSSILAATALIMLSGCDKENPFYLNSSEGQLNCNALLVDYVNRTTRSGSVDVNDFEVHFVNTGNNEVVRSYIYADMPEVVALPAGEYKAVAVYGDREIDAEWDNPYYRGSSSFSIEASKVTDDIDPIECTLQNMKVMVEVIDDTGFDIIGDDVQVVVRAGRTGELTYDSEHLEHQDAGYFKYEENGTTIVADFSGTIDGRFTDGITRIYEDAAPGNSYKINFTIKRPDNMDPGDVQIGDGIKIDATIAIKNENKVIDPNEPEDDIITDDMRPVNGSGKDDEPGSNTNDPNKGDDPSPGGPLIESMVDEMKLGKPYTIVDEQSTPVKFAVTSETGITEFKIKIVSSTLTKDELESVDLSDELDLINPGEYEEKLNGLGFPTGTDVMGKTKLEFDISQFVPLLNLLGSGDHKFELTVADKAGTSNATVYLKN